MTVISYLLTALIAYGIGLRVSARHWRRATLKAAAEFQAEAARQIEEIGDQSLERMAELRNAITSATEATAR